MFLLKRNNYYKVIIIEAPGGKKNCNCLFGLDIQISLNLLYMCNLVCIHVQTDSFVRNIVLCLLCDLRAQICRTSLYTVT